VALASAATGYAVYRGSRPEPYRPGEKLAGITTRLDLALPDDAPDVRFSDVTSEAGLSEFRSFAGASTRQLPEDMGSGAAWGDFDGDGFDDLFVASNGGPLGAPEAERARSRLYRNRGDGTFVEHAGLPEIRILGMGAAWGDHDADGDLDLAVTGYDALLLLRNDGGTFVRDGSIGEHRGFWAGASWADFDHDSDLDLYVCGYVQYQEDSRGAERSTQQYGQAVPYTLNPASFRPERNLLLRNDGRAGFVDVAAELGVDNTQGRSLSAVWHDLDGNGWPDIYVANDVSDNALFLNRGGRFEDASHGAWVADHRGAMGLAVGDWNRDGDDDLFITHWIAQENALYDSMLADMAARGQADGLRFMDVADQRGLGQIALQFVGWGAEFVDLDSDGWLDLPVANGSTFETDEHAPGLRPQHSFLFWNRRGETFHDLSASVPQFDEPRVSRGLAASDYDADGDLDLAIVDRDAGVRLLRNDTPQQNRIALRLRARRGEAIEMTRIEAHLPSAILRRTVGGVSYLSQSSRTLHIGLGDAQRVERVAVTWPDGKTQSFENIEANALYEVLRDEPRLRSVVSWAGATAPLSRELLAEFWRAQRAGMHAMKVERDPARAIASFERALELDPGHADSLYYLANCLAATGDLEGALDRLAEMMRLDPLSHRAHKRWGTLRAMTARDTADLDAAVRALERTAAINPEETGAFLVLGEVDLLRGDERSAGERLARVVRTNPQAGEAFFVLGYLAWERGDRAAAVKRLEQSAGTRGKEWKPAGASAEGDVKGKMHAESTPFEEHYAAWDGSAEPARAFAGLRARLSASGGAAVARRAPGGGS